MMKAGTRMPSLEGATDWLNRSAETQGSNGRPTLVHFWAISCEICKEKMPRVAEWREKYRDRLRVVAVHMPRYEEDTQVESVREMAARLNISELCAVDNEHYLRDAFENEHGYTPAYYLFDAENRLRSSAAGERGTEVIARSLEQMFKVEHATQSAPVESPAAHVSTSPEKSEPAVVVPPDTLVVSPQKLPPFCLDCQLILEDDSRFCSNCGRPVGTLPEQPEPQEQAKQVESRGEPVRQPGWMGKTEELPPLACALDDPLAGHTIDGKYEIVARLGQGGMSTVYRARRMALGDEVAIKILLPKFVADGSLIERFRREARAAAMLRHPNIVVIYDYGESSDRDAPAYIVMELVEGKTLRQILSEEKRFAPSRAVELMRCVCAGVGAAHRRGIVHRDMKPDNVIVTPGNGGEDECESVKVVDFGIAKLRDMASLSTLTQTGVVVGTPYYMSPEQCRGDELDAHADVYSLGAMMYEMLAGRPPFTAATLTGIIAKHLYEPPPALPDELQIPPALSHAVMRALAKTPDERHPDAASLARDLQASVIV
jgi:tRNA A-37 threonylcarbamoyl transferase component Bud32/thiol-disulfide isomerase/thioredoxin